MINRQGVAQTRRRCISASISLHEFPHRVSILVPKQLFWSELINELSDGDWSAVSMDVDAASINFDCDQTSAKDVFALGLTHKGEP